MAEGHLRHHVFKMHASCSNTLLKREEKRRRRRGGVERGRGGEGERRGRERGEKGGVPSSCMVQPPLMNSSCPLATSCLDGIVNKRGGRREGGGGRRGRRGRGEEGERRGTREREGRGRGRDLLDVCLHSCILFTPPPYLINYSINILQKKKEKEEKERRSKKEE